MLEVVASWDCGVSDVDPERSGRPWRWCHLVAGHRPVRSPDGGDTDPGFDPARVERLAGGAVAPADLVAGRGLGIDLAVSGQLDRRGGRNLVARRRRTARAGRRS